MGNPINDRYDFRTYLGNDDSLPLVKVSTTNAYNIWASFIKELAIAFGEDVSEVEKKAKGYTFGGRKHEFSQYRERALFNGVALDNGLVQDTEDMIDFMEVSAKARNESVSIPSDISDRLTIYIQVIVRGIIENKSVVFSEYTESPSIVCKAIGETRSFFDGYKIPSIRIISIEGNENLDSYTIDMYFSSEKGFPYIKPEQRRQILIDSGYKKGGIYLACTRRSGRYETASQDFSVRMNTRTPEIEGVSLLKIVDIGKQGIICEIIAKSMTYACTVLSFRNLPKHAADATKDDLRSTILSFKASYDYRQLAIEGTLIRDEDYILGKLSNNNLYKNATVWLGNEDDFDPNGEPVVRDLTEPEMIRTVLTQRGYDYDWSDFDKEYGIKPTFFMRRISSIRAGKIDRTVADNAEGALVTNDTVAVSDDAEFEEIEDF